MVYDFERNKIRQQEIEVKALIALMEQDVLTVRSWDIKQQAINRLYEIAFPEQLAEKINQEKLEYQ